MTNDEWIWQQMQARREYADRVMQEARQKYAIERLAKAVKSYLEAEAEKSRQDARRAAVVKAIRARGGYVIDGTKAIMFPKGDD